MFNGAKLVQDLMYQLQKLPATTTTNTATQIQAHSGLTITVCPAFSCCLCLQVQMLMMICGPNARSSYEAYLDAQGKMLPNSANGDSESLPQAAVLLGGC